MWIPLATAVHLTISRSGDFVTIQMCKLFVFGTLWQCFFVTVRAGTAYRKIWRLDNNFFCSHNKVDCSEIPIVLSNLLYHYFFIKLWQILILWLAKMPNAGMPAFTLIATGWRHQNMRTGKYCFTKKAMLCGCNCHQVWRRYDHAFIGFCGAFCAWF